MDIMLQRILSLIPDRHGADAEFARSLGYKSGNVVPTGGPDGAAPTGESCGRSLKNTM